MTEGRIDADDAGSMRSCRRWSVTAQTPLDGEYRPTMSALAEATFVLDLWVG
ncbi:hypothetical protein ACFQL0_11530 [Haloplanus litoreus]|uniref:Uncharacterized protein n=1 Tax=Haloplanus litoreus TaxID=767515 RepID=A0ABD5ZZX5_9EURY